MSSAFLDVFFLILVGLVLQVDHRAVAVDLQLPTTERPGAGSKPKAPRLELRAPQGTLTLHLDGAPVTTASLTTRLTPRQPVILAVDNSVSYAQAMGIIGQLRHLGHDLTELRAPPRSEP